MVWITYEIATLAWLKTYGVIQNVPFLENYVLYQRHSYGNIVTTYLL